MKTTEKVNLLEIVTFEHQTEKNELNRSYVVPGKLEVERGEKVTWKADKTGIMLFFPDEKLFGSREASASVGEEVTLRVNKDIEPGRYPYAVYTEKTNDFAEGGSMPVMIIR